MQKSIMCAVVLAIGVFAFATPALQAAEAKPTIAIVSFEAAQGGWTLPLPRLGETVAQLMLDRLVTAGAFRVVDGEWLQVRRSRAGKPPPLEMLRANAADAGVDYLVFGTITRFSNERRNRTVGGAGFRLPLVGGLRRGEERACRRHPHASRRRAHGGSARYHVGRRIRRPPAESAPPRWASLARPSGPSSQEARPARETHNWTRRSRQPSSRPRTPSSASHLVSASRVARPPRSGDSPIRFVAGLWIRLRFRQPAPPAARSPHSVDRCKSLKTGRQRLHRRR